MTGDGDGDGDGDGRVMRGGLEQTVVPEKVFRKVFHSREGS